MLSGTSRDGADTVLVRFHDNKPEVVASQCVAYPKRLADMLKRMIERHRRPDDHELHTADEELSGFFALAAWGLLNKAGVSAADITAVGSHGQTVWHHPVRPNPETIQLGNPQRIADLLNIPTVGHFRQADIKAGGQGAPLAPLLHQALLKPRQGVCAVVNIGGIANVSLLQEDGSVSGFDTGPGNCLLDGWINTHQGAGYDRAGEWAAGGKVDDKLLALLLDDPYFEMRPPKSTGVEYFNFYWLQGRLGARGENAMHASLRDIQATLSELTARTIADAILDSSPTELLVCGGGTHNVDLLNRLRRLLPGITVQTTESRGLDPDWVEGVLFAWLARERLAGRKQDTSRITGAREQVLLGEVFYPANTEA